MQDKPKKRVCRGAGSLLIPRSGDVLHQFGYHSHNMENVNLYWPRDGFRTLFFLLSEKRQVLFIYWGNYTAFLLLPESTITDSTA